MRVRNSGQMKTTVLWRQAFGIVATSALVTLGLTAGSGAAGATTVSGPAHARRVPHPLAPAAVKSERPAGRPRVMEPELSKTPALIPATAVAHTFVVDTTSDPAVTNAGTQCASGNSGTCSLRAAVEAADADSGVIDAVSVPSGKTITLTLGTIVLSNSMIIDGNGSTVSGGASAEIFELETGSADVNITGLTLKDGSSEEGGAFYVDAGSLVLSDVTLTGNNAVDGGALYIEGGSVWISGSTFSANSASAAGGGIYVDGGSEQITDSTFGGTTSADGNTSPEGAGIYADGNVVVSGSTFDYNTSGADTDGEGIGIYNGGQMSLAGSAIDHNTSTAGGKGAGLYNGDVIQGTDLVVDGNSITGDGDAQGAGIFDDAYNGTYTDVTLADNSTDVTEGYSEGGAIYTDSYIFSLAGATITGTSNTTASTEEEIYGGAIYAQADQTTLTDVRVSGVTNMAAGDGYVYGGALYTNSDTTASGLTSSSVSSTAGDVYGGSVYNDEALSLADSTISETTAHGTVAGGGYVYGGAVFNGGEIIGPLRPANGNDTTLTVDDVTVTDTSAKADIGTTPAPSTDESGVYGGAWYNEGALVADAVTTIGVTATASGGDGYVEGGAMENDGYSSLKDFEVLNLATTADDGVYGGALYNDDVVDGSNVTLADDSTKVLGGPDASNTYADGSILYSEYEMNLVNATVANDSGSTPASAEFNWGVEIDSSDGNVLTNATLANDAIVGPTGGKTTLIWVGEDSSLSLANTIVAATNPALNCGLAGDSASLVSVYNNLDSGTTCGFTHPGDIENANPDVLAAADNGGLVETAALQVDSPAIDAGDNSVCPATDARGVIRPQGSSCDIGAYELVQSAPGYFMAASDGGVFNYGAGAKFFGSLGGVELNAPIVGVAADPITGGYWLVASDGGVFAYNAPFFGSTGGVKLTKPIVGIAAAPDGDGYWLVASDGGVFNFGPGAQFHGSTGGATLSKSVVGIAADPLTGGYWLVASDGGVFAFDAPFYGSTGGLNLAKPIVGIAAAPQGHGYWLVASDGGVFNYGPGAKFYGSTGGITLSQPVIGISADPATGGYWTVASDGGVFAFNAPFLGSTGGADLTAPVVSVGSI